MDRINNISSLYLSECVCTRVKYGSKGSIPIEQIQSKDFQIDPATGRPYDEITKLVKSQNAIEMQTAFSHLDEFKGSSLPDDVSNADALRYLKPRLVQSPSELAQWQEGLLKFRLNEQAKAKAKEAFEAKQKADAEYLENFRSELINSNKSDKS